MKSKCPRCDGVGQRTRTKEEDGTEADPDMHPFLAAQKKSCERCGGSGIVTLTPAETTKLVSNES